VLAFIRGGTKRSKIPQLGDSQWRIALTPREHSISLTADKVLKILQLLQLWSVSVFLGFSQRPRVTS